MNPLQDIKDKLWANDEGRLACKDDEKFLIGILRDKAPSDDAFSEAAFLLGRFYSRHNISVFREALKKAADAKKWGACYQIMIGLDNIGENPFDILFKEGVRGYSFDNDKDNEKATLDYLARKAK